MSLVGSDGRIIPERQTEADLMAFISGKCGLRCECVWVERARNGKEDEK